MDEEMNNPKICPSNFLKIGDIITLTIMQQNQIIVKLIHILAIYFNRFKRSIVGKCQTIKGP